MNSWFPSPFGSSSSSSNPPPPPVSSSSMSGNFRISDRPQSPSNLQLSPAEAAGVITRLKEKSVDELRKILNDKSAYEAFFDSLEQVKIQKNLRRELVEETLQLARENLENETRMMELRNQCMIIRTSELAAAQEKLNELEKQKDEILATFSPVSQLHRLQDAMTEVDKESEELHNKLLEKEMNLATFIQKHKKSRNVYQKRALLHLAAKTSV